MTYFCFVYFLTEQLNTKTSENLIKKMFSVKNVRIFSTMFFIYLKKHFGPNKKYDISSIASQQIKVISWCLPVKFFLKSRYSVEVVGEVLFTVSKTDTKWDTSFDEHSNKLYTIYWRLLLIDEKIWKYNNLTFIGWRNMLHFSPWFLSLSLYYSILSLKHNILEN